MKLRIERRGIYLYELTEGDRNFLWRLGYNKVRGSKDTYKKIPSRSSDLVKLVELSAQHSTLVPATAYEKQYLELIKQELPKRQQRLAEICGYLSGKVPPPPIPADWHLPECFELSELQEKCIAMLRVAPAMGILLDMGLGKTAIFATAFRNWAEKDPKPYLIVAPAQVTYSIKREFDLYFLNFSKEHVLLLDKTKKKNLENLATLPWKIAIVSYDRLRVFPELLKINWGGIAYDEASYLSNDTINTKTAYKLIKGTRPAKCIMLTGTLEKKEPIWRVTQLITPFAFEEERFTAFRENWYTPVVGNFYEWEFKSERTEEFNRRVAPYFIRCSFDEAVKGIPPTQFGTIPITMPKETLDCYKELSTRLITQYEIERLGQTTVVQAEGWNVLKRFILLGMLCAGIFREEGGNHLLMDTAKIQGVCDFVDKLPQDEQAIIVAEYKLSHAPIKQAFGDDCRILAALNNKQKQEAIKDFQEGRLRFLVIHRRSGGIGLNFANGKYVIWLHPYWSSIDYRQVNSRIRRKDTLTKNPGGRTFVYNVLSFSQKGVPLFDTTMLKVALGKIKDQMEFFSEVQKWQQILAGSK